jgi:hypothetical protein
MAPNDNTPDPGRHQQAGCGTIATELLVERRFSTARSTRSSSVTSSDTPPQDQFRNRLLARWQAGFEELFGLVAGRFAQVESRRRARLYLLGLLSGTERKNSWTISEQAGELSPDGMGAVAELLSLGR